MGGALLPRNSLHLSRALLPPPPPRSGLGSLSAKSNGSSDLGIRRCVLNGKVPRCCSVAESSYPGSSRYGGWDDPALDDGAEISGRIEAFRGVLVAMGIADGKCAILFFLGFLSAMAVSRVRVWNLGALALTGSVFVWGLLVGVARVGAGGDSPSHRRRNDEESGKLSKENMKDFGELLEDFGTKVSEMKTRLQGFVGLNHPESGEIERYLDVLDSLSLAAAPVKKIVRDSAGDGVCIGSFAEDGELAAKPGPKSSKKKREPVAVDPDLLQFLAAMFKEVPIGRAPPKPKDSSLKGEAVERSNSMDQGMEAGLAAADEKRATRNYQEDGKGDPFEGGDETSKRFSSGSTTGMSEETVRRVGSAASPEHPISSGASAENGGGSSHSRDDSCNHGMLSVDEDLRVLNGDSYLTSMQESYRKVVLQHNSRRTEIRTGQDRLHEYLERGFNPKAPEQEIGSFPREAGPSLKSERPPEAYARINRKVVDERGSQTVDFREKAVKLEFQTVVDDEQSKCDVGAEDKPSSSSSSAAAAAAAAAAGAETGSAEEEFNRIVKRGAGLLRQAGECLKGQSDEQTAEIFLYKSARLLSAAVALKPRSLLALGQLGNTCLLHGELKLKISRDLRTLLLRNGPSFMGKRNHQSRSGELSFLKKEKMVSALVDVCEECEELLIDAGRNYKMVLSIDENDVRALYNWGLALSFRAELIADTGPDAAIDADKVYLAAIEKFDAMMSRTGDYASEALFRWGVALRRRSQLRPRGSSEKVKLLRQAKSLFEDVLRVDAENPLVREALRSCVSELRLR